MEGVGDQHKIQLKADLMKLIVNNHVLAQIRDHSGIKILDFTVCEQECNGGF